MNAAQHKRAQARLAAQASRALLEVWPLWDVGNRASWARFVRAAHRIVNDQARASAALGAAYYNGLRPSGPTEVTEAEGPAVEQLDIALTATAVVSTVKALRSGQTLVQARRAGYARAAKVVERHVLDAGRTTILEASLADPAADGWQRVTEGTCSFCEMRAGNPGGTAFGSHDNCACSAEPVFKSAVSEADKSGDLEDDFFDDMGDSAAELGEEELEGELSQLLDDEFGGYADTVVGDAKEAVQSYQGSYYRTINQELREYRGKIPSGWDGEITKHLDDVFASAPGTSKDLLAYRIGVAPEMEVGETFIDHGFVSTTLHEEFGTYGMMGSGGAESFVVRIPQGANAIAPKTITKQMAEEFEVTLPRGSRFKYIGRDAKDRKVFEWIEVA